MLPAGGGDLYAIDKWKWLGFPADDQRWPENSTSGFRFQTPPESVRW